MTQAGSDKVQSSVAFWMLFSLAKAAASDEAHHLMHKKAQKKIQVREMAKNLYLKVMQRIVYFSLMIVSIVMRKIVQKLLGLKLTNVKVDKRMINQQSVSWVSKLS